jgi:hypothetical protein
MSKQLPLGVDDNSAGGPSSERLDSVRAALLVTAAEEPHVGY